MATVGTIKGGVSYIEGGGVRGAQVQEKGGWGTSCGQGKSLILLGFIIRVFHSVVSFVHISK